MFRTINITRVLLLIVLTTILTFPQARFRELQDNKIDAQQLNYIESSSVRETILLDGEWQVYNADDEGKKRTAIFVPSNFEGDNILVFEKGFNISSSDIKEKQFTLNFAGLSYSAEIYVNNSLIYKHLGGEYPFSVLLPKDILKGNTNNVIGIKVNPRLDPLKSFPMRMGFFEPAHPGGIFRDVFITATSNTFISEYNFAYDFRQGTRGVELNFKAILNNLDFKTANDSSDEDSQFELKLFVKKLIPGEPLSSTTYNTDIPVGKQRNVNITFNVENIDAWSPNQPNVYQFVIRMFKKNVLVDEVVKNISFYTLTADGSGLTLNGNKFQLNGVTYIPSSSAYGNLMTYDQMIKDIKMIKDLGFNAVRFEKNIPHPFFLYLCERLGLLVFLDFPIHSLPESYAENKVFIENSKSFLNAYLNAYKNYSSVAGINLGSGYLGGLPAHKFYLHEIVSSVRNHFHKIITASYQNFFPDEIKGIDLYGFEILNTDINEVKKDFAVVSNKFGKGRVFISSVGYVANIESATAFTPHSQEAQAKFFDDFFNFLQTVDMPGYFINTMFDYKAGYSTIMSGFNNLDLINLGILGEDRGLNRLTYKVIDARLHNKEKVTLSLGFKKDDAPMIFTVAGLLLALLFLLLLRSGSKFREHALRALRQPYNFYQDIRDLRIISGLQTTGLALIVSAVLAVTFASFFFHLKNNYYFEKLVLSFGSQTIADIAGYFAWHPMGSIVWLTALFFIAAGIITLIIKLFSLMVMQRVAISNCYYTTVWSMLPYVLLIPIVTVLYRVLLVESIAPFLYLGFAFIIIWSLYRLLKGIYVIFDITPFKSYFFGFLFVVVVLGIFLMIYQSTDSTIDKIYHTYIEFRYRP